jgi:hypothetical protein
MYIIFPYCVDRSVVGLLSCTKLALFSKVNVPVGCTMTSFTTLMCVAMITCTLSLTLQEQAGITQELFPMVL